MPTAPAVRMLDSIKDALVAFTTGDPAVPVFADVEISDFEPPWVDYPSVLILPTSPHDEDGSGTMQARIRIYQDFVLGDDAVRELLQLAYDTMLYLSRKGDLGELADGMFISTLKQIEYGADPVGGKGIPPVRWITLILRPQWLDAHDL